MWDLKERQVVYKKAGDRWGIKSQMIVALEELSELQVEIAKHLNNKREDELGLIDELADARIMIEQLELNFDLSILVENRMFVKMSRLDEILTKPHPTDKIS